MSRRQRCGHIAVPQIEDSRAANIAITNMLIKLPVLSDERCADGFQPLMAMRSANFNIVLRFPDRLWGKTFSHPSPRSVIGQWRKGQVEPRHQNAILCGCGAGLRWAKMAVNRENASMPHWDSMGHILPWQLVYQWTIQYNIAINSNSKVHVSSISNY